MNSITTPEQAELDAKIFQLRDTLQTLLQRYRDLSFMEAPAWETDQEIPVKNAKKMLRKDKYSEEIREELFLLRKLANAVRLYEKYRQAKQETSAVLDEDVDPEEKTEHWHGKIIERLNQYLDLKT